MREFCRALIVGLVLAMGGALAPVAMAQEDGVTVDPDSPAGKEYALPLDRARGDAGSGDAQPDAPDAPSQQATAAPSFGEGITTPSQGDGKRATRERKGERGREKPSSTPDPSATPEPTEVAVREANADAGGPGSGLALVVGGALVALIGGAVGLGMRRRRS